MAKYNLRPKRDEVTVFIYDHDEQTSSVAMFLHRVPVIGETIEILDSNNIAKYHTVKYVVFCNNNRVDVFVSNGVIRSEFEKELNTLVSD